jgi:hypothetical protein
VPRTCDFVVGKHVGGEGSCLRPLHCDGIWNARGDFSGIAARHVQRMIRGEATLKRDVRANLFVPAMPCSNFVD